MNFGVFVNYCNKECQIERINLTWDVCTVRIDGKKRLININESSKPVVKQIEDEKIVTCKFKKENQAIKFIEEVWTLE